MGSSSQVSFLFTESGIIRLLFSGDEDARKFAKGLVSKGSKDGHYEALVVPTGILSLGDIKCMQTRFSDESTIRFTFSHLGGVLC